MCIFVSMPVLCVSMCALAQLPPGDVDEGGVEVYWKKRDGGRLKE